ncbi:hypothetical protein CsSME_00014180 [Camellia sinensis var. sinensis]
MVCQAASQTRFRALKHESGIAGSATIIVRVIACFQPLQDCQDFGSWFHSQLSDRQSPNLNTLIAPFNPGQQNAIPACMSPCANLVSSNGTLPGPDFSGVPHSKVNPPNEPHGWFYCLPRYRQAFTPVSNSILKQKIHAGAHENCKEVVTPDPTSVCAQKRFLVFDQSGDQTTLIFGSRMGTPVPCMTSWVPKLNSVYDLNKTQLGAERVNIQRPEPILTDEYNENHQDDVRSEMHEDTEEINALLYSDNDDYSEDDEEASTGHSPSTMTAYNKQELLEEGEEVDSSAGPAKRMKLFDGGYDVPSLKDTATSSVKSKRCVRYEDDAESSCADGIKHCSREFGSLVGNKRLRKEKIRETVSIIQSIIPGGNVKGKNAIVILDEAISYLKSLKHKAEALGIYSL